jgi:hypothetical protein
LYGTNSPKRLFPARAVAKILAVDYPETVGASVFLESILWLLILSLLGFYGIERPVRTWSKTRKHDILPRGLELTGDIWSPKKTLLFLYYPAMVAVFSFFYIVALGSLSEQEWVVVADITSMSAVQTVLQILSWLLLVPMPALIQGLLGHIIFPAVIQPTVENITTQLKRKADAALEVGTPAFLPANASVDDHTPPFRMYWRIVTRGNNPNLVSDNVSEATRVLLLSKLPPCMWVVEVVTDTQCLSLSEETKVLLANNIQEVVVPTDYKPPKGALFKARALLYAVARGSTARRHDWIIHLDEETRFNVDTVSHALHHCWQQHERCMSGAQKYGNIGQGVIKYNTEHIENYLTTLADTIRVGDDYGKFALQYRMMQEPLIGMHGSFVICQNAVEDDVSSINSLLDLPVR